MIDLTTAKPREIEGYLREQVRKIFGDAIENRANIFSAHGFYSVALSLDEKRAGSVDALIVEFTNFRKTEAKKIVKAMRALK